MNATDQLLLSYEREERLGSRRRDSGKQQSHGSILTLLQQHLAPSYFGVGEEAKTLPRCHCRILDHLQKTQDTPSV